MITKLISPPLSSTRQALTEHVRIPLYRNAYALMLNTGITSGLGLVYWALAARLYAPETVGLNSALLATMFFLSGLAQLNFKNALVRFLPTAGRRSARLVWGAYGITALLGLGAGIVFLLGLDVWGPGPASLAGNGWRSLAFIGAVVGWGIFALQDMILTGLRNTHWVPIENAIYSALKLALLVLLVNAWGELGIFLSFTLPVLLLIVPVNLYIFRTLLPKHELTSSSTSVPSLSNIARFLGADYLGQLLTLATVTLLPLLVTVIAGPSANAFFYVAWLVASTLQMLNVNFATSLTVEGAADPGQLANFCARYLAHSVRLLLPAVALLLVAAPFLLALFGRSYADESVMVLRLLVLAALPHSVIALSMSIARVSRRSRQIVLIQAANCTLILGLSALWLNAYGIPGVGLGVLVGESILAMALLLVQIIPLLRTRTEYPNPIQ